MLTCETKESIIEELNKIGLSKNNVDFLKSQPLKDLLYEKILRTTVGRNIKKQLDRIVSESKQCIHYITLLSDQLILYTGSYGCTLTFDNNQKSFENLLNYMKQKRIEDKSEKISYFYVIGAFGIEHTSLIMISDTSVYLIDSTPEKQTGTLISNFSNIYKERIQIFSLDLQTQTDVCNCSFVKYLFENLSQFTELGIKNIYINRYWDLLDGNICFQTTQKYVEKVQETILSNPENFEEAYIQEGLTLVNENVLQSIGKDSKDARHMGIINESKNPILQSIACEKSKQYAKKLSEESNYINYEAIAGKSSIVSKTEKFVDNTSKLSQQTKTSGNHVSKVLQETKVSVLQPSIRDGK